MGGMIGFNRSESDQGLLDEMSSIIRHVSTREKPSDDYALLEAFGLIVYEREPLRLSPDVPPPGSSLRASNLLDRIVELFMQRFVGAH